MEDIISHANDILDKAIVDGNNHGGALLLSGGNSSHFTMNNCHGVIIISSFEVGALVMGASIGRGIILRRRKNHRHNNYCGSEEWSSPCACKLSGVGIGLLAGLDHTDVIALCMDTAPLNAFVGGNEYTFGPQQTHVLGLGCPIWKSQSHLDFNNVNNGIIPIVSNVHGCFIGVSLEGTKLTPDDKANMAFYGSEAVTARRILLDDGRGTNNVVQIPNDKIDLMNHVYRKLAELDETLDPNPNNGGCTASGRSLDCSNVQVDSFRKQLLVPIVEEDDDDDDEDCNELNKSQSEMYQFQVGAKDSKGVLLSIIVEE